MYRSVTLFAEIVVVIALLASGGCGEPKEFGVDCHSMGWDRFSKNPVPGIDRGGVTAYTLRCGPPKGVQLVLWSDTSPSSHGSGTTRRTFVEGRFTGTGGRAVGFLCQTTDGRTARFKIDGKEFDLAEGSLFLVSTHQEKPRVAQLAQDVTKIPNETGALREFALANAEISKFFHEAQQATEDK
jgi:hypothetical protein